MALKKLRRSNVEDVITNNDPESLRVHGFDLRTLDKFKPYNPEEELPKGEVKIGRNGRPTLIKRGEPRFYFDPTKTELIRVTRGVTKKTELAWKYREYRNEPNKTEQNKAIRNHLLKVVKIPVRGVDFD